MKKFRTFIFSISLVSLCFSATAGDTFQLSNATLDGGGGDAVGGVFVLKGTIGQPDAGRLQGGSFELNGGFWASGEADLLYKDGFEAN